MSQLDYADTLQPPGFGNEPVVPARAPASSRGIRKQPSYWLKLLFGLAMRMVPRRHRAGVAVRLAGVLAWPMRRTRAFSKLSKLRLNSARDISLHLLFSAMTASGTRFDLPLSVEGENVLKAALASGRGTLIVSPHVLLSLLILRHLHDRGHTPTIVAREPGISLAGTPTVVPTVPPDSGVLLTVRRHLRKGGIVCAMIDRMGTNGKQTRAFDSPVGQIRVSDSIFRLAARYDAQVLFTVARADENRVRLTVAAPRPTSAGSPEAIADDFVGFVQAHALAIA